MRQRDDVTFFFVSSGVPTVSFSFFLASALAAAQGEGVGEQQQGHQQKRQGFQGATGSRTSTTGSRTSIFLFLLKHEI